MAPPASDSRSIESYDDLLEPFHSACKPASEFRIGAEQEKIGLLFQRGSDAAGRKPDAIPYEADGDAPSVVHVLRELAASHGWAEEGSGPLIHLVKGSASVTLEPGAQLELSGAPLKTIHEIHDEARAHLAELDAISRGFAARDVDLRWLGVGFHPTASQADLGWVPKARYGVMKEYLPTRGQHGLDMMRRTATVQANFDYSSEENAMRVLRVALRLAPFFTAMFANAPYYEGELWGGVSYRAKVWLSVDPDRQGLVPAAIKLGAKFRDYVEWALDAPMFLVLRDDPVLGPGARIVPNTGQPFRAFLKDGFEGERATMADWLTHLNTLFPEVRLKKTIEVRGADSTPPDLVEAPSALWTGLLYDPIALDEADLLSEDFTVEELETLRKHIPKDGLRAPFRSPGGRATGRAADVAARMIDIARGGLARRGHMRDGLDEGRWLDPLSALVANAECPADRLIAAALDGTPAADWSARLDTVFLTSAHR